MSMIFSYALYIIGRPPYIVSKIGVNRFTELLAKDLTSDPTRPGVLVNAVSHDSRSLYCYRSTCTCM